MDVLDTIVAKGWAGKPMGGRMPFRRSLVLFVVLIASNLVGLRAQTLRTLKASDAAEGSVRSVCGGGPIFKPASLPPSGPVVFLVALCPEPVASKWRVPPETYLHQIHLRASRPSQGEWVPYDEGAERAIFEDYRRLWDNLSLADLSIDVTDYHFENGVIGKIVSYHITERT
jgi:hypothetical protein